MARTAWHPAFCCAIEIELEDYAQYLEFNTEYELAKEPLRLDILVIKKKSDVTIDKNIGRIFKKHNIFEYKSPTTYVSIDSFYKILGYACIYKAITGGENEAPADEITITIVCDSKPVKLFDYLTGQHRAINEKWSGIYYIEGFSFAIQIVVRNKLPETENFYLKCLTNDLSIEMLLKALDEQNAHKENRKYDEYFSTIFIENVDLLMEVALMKSATPAQIEKFEKIALENGMAEKFIKKGEEKGEAKGEEKAKIEAAIALLDVLSDRMIAEKMKLPLATVRELRQKYENNN